MRIRLDKLAIQGHVTDNFTRAWRTAGVGSRDGACDMGDGSVSSPVDKVSNEQPPASQTFHAPSTAVGHTSIMRPLGKPPPRAMSSVKAPDGMHSLQRQRPFQPAQLLIAGKKVSTDMDGAAYSF